MAAAATGAVASRFAPAMLGLPEHWTRATSDDVAGPAYGIALVSRWPVREWYVRRWPALPVRVPLYLPGPQARLSMLHDQPRLLLAAVIESPAGPLTVACTHLSFVAGWNVVQFSRALRFVRSLPGPRFLLGNLNLPRFVVAPVASAAGWRPLAHGRTFSSRRRNCRSITSWCIRAGTPPPYGSNRPRFLSPITSLWWWSCPDAGPVRLPPAGEFGTVDLTRPVARQCHDVWRGRRCCSRSRWFTGRSSVAPVPSSLLAPCWCGR